GFEKRLVVNPSKTYTQLRTVETLPGLDGMVGVTICEFPLWPEPPDPGDEPQGNIERWAYFFRETKYLGVVPPALSQAPYREALEITRLAGFSDGELDVYERVKMSEQDARGALSLAQR